MRLAHNISILVNTIAMQPVMYVFAMHFSFQRACSAIAVLLQYLFLVTFMWMLMEGVVLYVTLVKVFVQNYKYYIIGFTVASYG